MTFLAPSDPALGVLTRSFMLSPLEAALLSELLRAVAPTPAQMEAALTRAGSEAPRGRTMSVHLCHLRAKLRDVARIDTLRCEHKPRTAVGYALDGAGRAALIELALAAPGPQRLPVDASWRLSAAQRVIIEALLSRESATALELASALRGAGFRTVKEGVKPLVRGLRKRLAAFGVELDTLYGGRGYRLSEASRQRLAAANAGALAP